MPEYIPAMKRVRVRGGRVTHAVTRDEAGIQRTACGSRRLRACDNKQLASEPVTCPACQHTARDTRGA